MGLGARPGDKVRIRRPPHAGARGVVQAIDKGLLLLRLDDSGKTLQAAENEVTNFSLAARKAWRTLPTRAVGRPKGLKFCDRVSVTLRIDRDLWEEFQTKESLGLIDHRTATINRWLRQKLRQLDRMEA